MNKTCPIVPATLDETAVRLGAGITLLVALAALALRQAWLPLLLAVDFALRSRGINAASPVAQAARALAAGLGLAPRPVNAGPKRFAALAGACFALAIGLGFACHQAALAWTAGGILLVCAALEAFLGFCVGCRIYGLLRLGAGRA